MLTPGDMIPLAPRSRTTAALVAATILALSPGCGDDELEAANEGGPRDDGGAGDEADGEEATSDGAEGLPGPISLVVSDVEVVTERLCDLDGDGVADNAVADLGSPGGSILSAAVTSLLAGPVTGPVRLLFHFPWVEDVSTPHDLETSLVLVDGVDTDVPPDPTDDFSGEERFAVAPSSMTECLEPSQEAHPASLDEGALSAEGVLGMSSGGTELFSLLGARVEGVVAPESRSASLTACGYETARRLGTVPASVLPVATTGGDTLLEILLAGGASLGIPGVPGLSLDVDLDGDGIERIVLDEGGRVESCIDGDSTPLSGRLCWQDERIADGVSLTVRFETVFATLSDLAFPAELMPIGGCAEGLPDESEWGPCPPRWSGSCERGETRPCEDECGQPGHERCSWDCSRWERCLAPPPEALRVATCEDLALEGSSCDDEAAEARLVSGPSQAGGIRLRQSVTVGRSPILVDAAALVSRGELASPGAGWAVTAYLEPVSDWLGDWHFAGVEPAGQGYTIQWFFGSLWEEDDDDYLQVGPLDGSPEVEHFSWGDSRLTWAGSRLDATTDGVLEQRLRMIIVPDDPETDGDETAVGGLQHHEGSFSPLLTGCSAGSCPIPIAPGDVLSMAVTASTGDERDAVVSVSFTEGLTVRADPPCP